MAASPDQTMPRSTSPFSSAVFGLSESYTFTSGSHFAITGRTFSRFALVTASGPRPSVASAQVTISSASSRITMRPLYFAWKTSS